MAGEVQSGLTGEAAADDRPRALYFSHPACLAHDPREGIPGHPESPERLREIERRLDERDWLGWQRREAPAAIEAELELVHTADHVRFVRELSRSGGGPIDADTYAGPASFEAALHAAGAACEMTRALLGGEAEVGFCAVRPAGHHAEPDRAMGFCLFNNLAIAAELAIRQLGIERVLVVDWDVHHGNGTVAAFHDRADVLVAGIHERGIYPGTGSGGDRGSGAGEGYTIDLPVSGGSEEDVWLSLLEGTIEPAAVSFDPQLILVSAGFDAHRDDPLATCWLEAASFGRMAAWVARLGRSLGAPVGAVLEGGYSPPALAESVAATMAALGETA
ncbi:MAG TPA: histone deacetylase [Solirubrobacterales bacterium]|nr:histone deacetylase [Solirubrobacterales bacterium]